MLGDRPGRSDFGLYGQLSQLVKWDPTPVAVACDRAPKVIHWVDRMDDLSWLEPADWGTIGGLDETVRDLLVEIGATYVPFMLANAAALSAGADEVVCEIGGREYRQAPFKYQAKCLMWLREAHSSLAGPARTEVDAALAGTGCEQLFA